MGRINITDLQSISGKKTLSDEEKEIRRKKSQRKYYLANKAKIMAQHRVYASTFISKEKKNKWANIWYHANKTKVQAKRKLKLESMTEADRILQREKQRIYRQKNKQKISENRKRNYWKNREAIRASQKIYYEKTDRRDRQSTYRKNSEAMKANKINKHVLAKKDKESIQYYINNIWNRMI